MNWIKVCEVSELTPEVGVAALVKEHQVALFYLPALGAASDAAPASVLYALDNWDPQGEAFVISRGIVGDLGGVPCVASPLYKHHYALADGRCLEDGEVALRPWPVRLEGDSVYIQARS